MILVVDDHDDTRRMVVRMLSLDGYEVVGAASGEEVLRFLETAVPSLMILDFNMPGIDGLTLLAEVRKNPRHEKVPVIMFSAGDVRVKEQALRAGVEAYIVKGSLDWAYLQREIVRLIGTGAPRPKESNSAKPLSKDVG